MTNSQLKSGGLSRRVLAGGVTAILLALVVAPIAARIAQGPSLVNPPTERWGPQEQTVYVAIEVTGGTPPYAFQVSAALAAGPGGSSFSIIDSNPNDTTALVKGQLGSPGKYNITVSVTDSVQGSTSATFLWRISSWQVGDVIAGVGNGEYEVYAPDGTLRETLAVNPPESLYPGYAGDTTGCAVDWRTGVLYTTDFDSRVFRIDPVPDSDGTRAIQEFSSWRPGTVQAEADRALTADEYIDWSPESVVIGKDGRFYVGHVSGYFDPVNFLPTDSAGIVMARPDPQGDPDTYFLVKPDAQQTFVERDTADLEKRLVFTTPIGVTDPGTRIAYLESGPGTPLLYQGTPIEARRQWGKRLHGYDASGNPIGEFDTPYGAQGTDWIDLAADQNTLFHTSEYGPIYKFNLSANQPLEPYAVLQRRFFALRLLPPGDGSGGVIAADTSRIIRLKGVFDAQGAYTGRGEQDGDGYGIKDLTGWFAVNLDPTAKKLWAGSTGDGTLHRFDLASGVLEASIPTGARARPILSPNGSVTYPLNGVCVVLEYTASREPCNGLDDDGNGVADDNCLPTAVDDAYETDEDTSLTVDTSGPLDRRVLVNDIDPDSDPLAAILDSGPSHGTLALNPDGSFTYTPALNFAGTDTFTYKANEGAFDSNIATVTILVKPVNDAPIAADDAYTTAEGATLTVPAPGVLANDSDIEGDALSAVLLSGPANGVLTLDAAGSFTYTPNGNYHGPDSFAYTVSDGHGGTAAATVTLTVTPVNDAPVAVNDTYTTDEDTALTATAPGVLANDTDIDLDTLIVSAVTSVPANGTLAWNADGSFVYTPNGNYHGPDSFTYTVNDGNGGTAAATVTLTVTPVNDTPAAVNDSYTATEDMPLTVSAPGVLANDSDVDSAALTVGLVSAPAHGASFTLNANGSFSYVPAANFSGTDTFTYRANDGALDSNEATVTIDVTPLNDPPVAADDTAATNEDTAVVIAVLANDTDIDTPKADLTVSLVAGPANALAFSLNTDGTFSYTPAVNYNGLDAFTYKVNDGTQDSDVAKVTITVMSVNDAPVADDETFTTPEDTPLLILNQDLLGNDTDVDGDTLGIAGWTHPSHGTLNGVAGGFTYVPDPDYSGLDSFNYTVGDGHGGSDTATVRLIVQGVNDAPVAAGDSYTTAEDAPLTIGAPGVLANDTDIDLDTLTVSAVTSVPANGTLAWNADGSFVYTPNGNYHGPDSFAYTVNDGNGGTAAATVTLTVTPVNDAPAAVNDGYAATEDTPLTVGATAGVLANDSDVDSAALTVVLVSGPAHGALTLNADGSFTYVPVADYAGPDSFTYKANDGASDSNVATVTITVNPVNDAPLAQNASASGNEDTVISGTVSVSDVDSVSWTLQVVANPAHGTVVLNNDGTFSYTPSVNFAGPTDAFTYQANDGALDSNVATVTITVTPVNDAPVVLNDSYSVNEDTILSIAGPGVLANDSDVDSTTITAQLVNGPTHAASFTLNANGSFSYVPAANFSGTDTFTYKANDGALDSNVATVTIAVTPVNDPPVAVNDSYATIEDTTLTMPAPGVLGNDTDLDSPASALTVQLVAGSGPAHAASFTLNADGSFSYTPVAGYVGPDAFAYVVSDGTAGSNAATVSITVRPANQPPVCTAAAALPATIWPPNHKWVPIGIQGVTDPDGNPVTLTITSIFQDEPTNTDGDGNHTPDGRIVADPAGGSHAEVRAERSGTKKVPGDGRVYHVTFTATDPGGASCTGTVRVCVPHDQGGRSFCIDGGPLYDSTVVSPPRGSHDEDHCDDERHDHRKPKKDKGSDDGRDKRK